MIGPDIARAERAARAKGSAKWKPVRTDGSRPARRGLTLGADTSKRAPLSVIVGATLFWNTLAGSFLVAFLNNEIDKNGFSDGCIVFFLIPFVLAGLALIGATGDLILKQANPRAYLSLEEAQPTLGTVCRLRWRLDGPKSRIQKLTIAVVGREAATYDRGSSTVTDYETFFRWVLFDGQPQAGQGILTVSIPESTMPSLEARRNAIEWLVTVHGEIPWWPDVKEEFPFTVHVPNRGPR